MVSRLVRKRFLVAAASVSIASKRFSLGLLDSSVVVVLVAASLIGLDARA
jgi:hypothetical protein